MAFVGFTVAIVGFYVVASLEPHLGFGMVLSPAGQFGLVATTVLTLAGSVSSYRAFASRAHHLLPTTLGLLIPGAVWSTMVFTLGVGTGPTAATTAAVVAAGFGVLLLAQGFGTARWFSVFCGLGAVGLSLAASVVRTDAAAAERTFPALLVAVAGMACLYGLLVEIEVAENETHDRLLASEQEIETEIARTQDLLHDIRSGLLSIETAMALVESDIAAPLQTEAARLRKLTTKKKLEAASSFDLVAAIRPMIDARRAAGVEIHLVAPTKAKVKGDESDILSVVDNLISNAERHGSPPVKVGLFSRAGTIQLTVTDAGGGVDHAKLDWMFERGATSHPDGCGIGLARSRSLAESNDGRLTATTIENGRLRFVLALQAERTYRTDFGTLVS